MPKLPTWLFASMAAINIPLLFLYDYVPWFNTMAFGFGAGCALVSMDVNLATKWINEDT